MIVLGANASGAKGAPSAPVIGTATVSGTTATVTFTASSFSKLPITSYTVTSSPGGITGTGASSPISVSGLTGGTAYTFTVTATNANGTSTASAASNSVTPISYFFARINSGSTTDRLGAVSADSSGNIYIGGWINPSANVYQSYYAKLTSSGSMSWQKIRQIPSGYGDAYVVGVGTDSSGNVYFGGKTATGAKGQQASIVKIWINN